MAPLIADPAKSILQESFLHWAPKYTGRKFSLIHCDFPYGVNLFAGPQAGGNRHFEYDDSKEVFFRLLRTLCENLDRVMSISAHLLFWYSEKHGREARAMFQDLARNWTALLEALSPLAVDRADAAAATIGSYLAAYRRQRLMIGWAPMAISAPVR